MPCRIKDFRLWRRFTLVELLTVIAIIAILAAILLPGLRRARLKGTLTACVSNVRQCYIAMQGYAGDNNAWYPLVDESGAWPAPKPGFNGSSYSWSGPPGLLYPNYIPNPEVAYCPGLGGLTNFGWPKGAFGPNTTRMMFDYVNLRRGDLWAGKPWRAGMTYSNWWAGGVLFRCLSVNYEIDPRAWGHLEWVTEWRNDGTFRQRQMPVVGLQVNSPWDVRAIFRSDYVQKDAWWMAP